MLLIQIWATANINAQRLRAVVWKAITKNGAPVMVFQGVRVKIMIKTIFFLVLFAFGSIAQEKLEFGSIVVELNQIKLHVEYADTLKLRNRGLMYRKEMCGDCGMLFKFDYAKRASMWMKNTFIPLDVAFIKSDGRITDIRAMQPHDLTAVGASENVIYALEMNQGWFKKQGINVGDRIKITP